MAIGYCQALLQNGTSVVVADDSSVLYTCRTPHSHRSITKPQIFSVFGCYSIYMMIVGFLMHIDISHRATWFWPLNLSQIQMFAWCDDGEIGELANEPQIDWWWDGLIESHNLYLMYVNMCRGRVICVALRNRPLIISEWHSHSLIERDYTTRNSERTSNDGRLCGLRANISTPYIPITRAAHHHTYIRPHRNTSLCSIILLWTESPE